MGHRMLDRSASVVRRRLITGLAVVSVSRSMSLMSRTRVRGPVRTFVIKVAAIIIVSVWLSLFVRV